MKNVIYSKKRFTTNRGRAISIRECTPEPDCDTAVRKSFVYLVYNVDAISEKLPVPSMRVIKVVDTKNGRETFSLRIKGTVYVKRGRFIHRVDYLHALEVRMLWKTHELSSEPA